MDQPDFLEELRARTGPMHKKLEQTPVSQSIVSAGLDMTAYRNYLKKVHRLHAGVEASVFPVISSVIGDASQRRKAAVIEKDLETVGDAATATGPEFADQGFMADPAFCMGIMYVSEGSTLGGMVIVKNVQAALGNAAQDATGFLTVYGQQTGSRWKKFLQELETFQLACDAASRQHIIDGAIYGFERTYQIFSN